MRTLARILNPIGFVLGVAISVTAILLNQQLDAVQAMAGADAQPLTAADLLRNGSGKNAHIVLTDFRFGEPVVEKHSDSWQRVAIPITAVAKVDKPAHSLILRIDIQDQAELDALRQQTSLDVLAATSLSTKSVWGQLAKSTAPKADAKKDAAKDAAKPIVLVAPHFAVAGFDVLGGDLLFDRGLGGILWCIAAAGFTLAGLCVWCAWSISPPASELSADCQADRDALAHPKPHSIHYFEFWAYFMHSWQFYVAPIILLIAIAGVTVVFDHLLDPFTAPQGPASAICALVCLLAAWGCLAWVFRNRWYSPAEIHVHAGGLRMLQGSNWEGILWSDVKSVSPGEVATYQAGALASVDGQMVLTLRDGREIWILSNRYTDYGLLAKEVQTTCGEIIAREKSQELAATGIGDFGPIAVGPQGIILKGGLLVGDRLIEWNNIDAFEVDGGHLIIHLRDYWFFSTVSLPLADIPDYLPLLALLKTGGAQTAVADNLKVTLPAAPRQPTAAS